MWIALVTFSAFAALLVVTVGVDSASAHSLGYDSVDGREIRYEDHTRYDDARKFGVSQWNRLGSVSIRNEQSGTDLEFRDYKNCRDGVVGYWQWRSGVDLLSFNTCEFNRREPQQTAGS